MNPLRAYLGPGSKYNWAYKLFSGTSRLEQLLNDILRDVHFGINEKVRERIIKL